jgi:hypothetical protein
MFVMYAMFLSFFLLWVRPEMEFPVSPQKRFVAGLFAGITVATDYIGLVTLPLLYGYLLFTRLRSVPLRQSIRESLPFVAGTLPPLLFLFYTQWAMYGNPFLPGQFWMPNQNEYVQVGERGFDWPAPDLFVKNLIDPGYGIFSWGPILLLGVIPAIWYRADRLILPRRERQFVNISFLALLIFSSANQYARLQWNSGFRYLVPIVPFLFLAAADHWVRLPYWVRLPVAIVVLLHSWVLTVFREVSIQQSWQLFFTEGVQLPWLRVLRMTSPPHTKLLNGQFLPGTILAVTFVIVWVIWHQGSKAEAKRDHIAAAVPTLVETS